MKQLKINDELKKHIWKLKPEEFAQLEENIVTEGIRDKIVTWQEFIIDGHNRYEIALKHGLPFETAELDFDDIEDVKDWMDSNQLGRRNLTQDQWQISIGRRYNREKKEAHRPENKDANFAPLKTSDKLSEEYKVAPRTIHNYAKKAIEFDRLKVEKPELAEYIESGELSFKDIKREEKKQELVERFEQLNNKPVEKINRKYDVIVIDPPWEMEKIKRDVAPLQVGFDYPTMTIEQIKEFELPAEENCHVFMWITQKHLPHGFDIFRSWGVKYVLTFVWHKNGGFQPFGLPQYNCEFVLYGRIGTPEFFDFKDFYTCFDAKRNGHSVKPDEFYAMVNRVTAGNKIDIFNRRKIEGFDTYGNEAD